MSGAGRYAAYMGSKLWREHVRPSFMERARVVAGWDSFRCERCGGEFPPEGINVHHKHYARLYGAELAGDVEILCLPCHAKADKEREARESEAARINEESRADAAWRARIEGFMRGRHGRDWESVRTFDEAEEEFERFLVRLEETEE